MTADLPSVAPFQDPELELEDRLDDLLQFKPPGGWSELVAQQLVADPPLIPAGADENVAAREVLQLSDDEAEVSGSAEILTERYATALKQPLKALRWETAVERCPLLRDLQPLVLASTFNPTLIRELAHAAALELRQQGIALLVLPPITLASRESVSAECYGDDPYLAGRIATALVRGAAGRDLRRGLALVLDCGDALLSAFDSKDSADLMRWRAELLEPVAEMVRDGGLRALLLRRAPAAPVPAVDLRAELGEDSVLLCAQATADWELSAVVEATQAELLLGNDVERHEVAQALGEREAKRRMARVLRLKLRLGLCDQPPTAPPPPVLVDRLRERLALGAMVLLKNEGVLPVAAHGRVCVLVSAGLPQAAVDLLSAAFAESSLDASITHLSGLAPGEQPEAQQAYLETLASSAELVVWITPSASREEPLLQKTLAALEPSLLRVLLGPQLAQNLESATAAQTLLQLAGPEDASLRLLPAVLNGSRIASGRVAHDGYASHFPFGLGAAGANLDYEALTGPTSADSFSVIVLTQVLRNIGTQATVEVVQLYLKRPSAQKDQLLGFVRCALQPQEAVRIRLQLDSSLLAQVNTEGEWRVEPGVVELYVGASIGAPQGQLSIELTGEARTLKQHQRVSTLSTVEPLGGAEPD